MTSSTVISTYPTTSVSLSVNYLKVPADLSGSTDVPVIPSRYHLAIVDGAAELAFRARNNLDMAQAMRDAFDQQVLEMGDTLNVPNLDSAREMVIVAGSSTDW